MSKTVLLGFYLFNLCLYIRRGRQLIVLIPAKSRAIHQELDLLVVLLHTGPFRLASTIITTCLEGICETVGGDCIRGSFKAIIAPVAVDLGLLEKGYQKLALLDRPYSVLLSRRSNRTRFLCIFQCFLCLLMAAVLPGATGVTALGGIVMVDRENMTVLIVGQNEVPTY